MSSITTTIGVLLADARSKSLSSRTSASSPRLPAKESRLVAVDRFQSEHVLKERRLASSGEADGRLPWSGPGRGRRPILTKKSALPGREAPNRSAPEGPEKRGATPDRPSFRRCCPAPARTIMPLSLASASTRLTTPSADLGKLPRITTTALIPYEPSRGPPTAVYLLAPNHGRSRASTLRAGQLRRPADIVGRECLGPVSACP